MFFVKPCNLRAFYLFRTNPPPHPTAYCLSSKPRRGFRPLVLLSASKSLFSSPMPVLSKYSQSPSFPFSIVSKSNSVSKFSRAITRTAPLTEQVLSDSASPSRQRQVEKLDSVEPHFFMKYVFRAVRKITKLCRYKKTSLGIRTAEAVIDLGSCLKAWIVQFYEVVIGMLPSIDSVAAKLKAFFKIVMDSLTSVFTASRKMMSDFVDSVCTMTKTTLNNCRSRSSRRVILQHHGDDIIATFDNVLFVLSHSDSPSDSEWIEYGAHRIKRDTLSYFFEQNRKFIKSRAHDPSCEYRTYSVEFGEIHVDKHGFYRTEPNLSDTHEKGKERASSHSSSSDDEADAHVGETEEEVGGNPSSYFDAFASQISSFGAAFVKVLADAFSVSVPSFDVLLRRTVGACALLGACSRFGMIDYFKSMVNWLASFFTDPIFPDIVLEKEAKSAIRVMQNRLSELQRLKNVPLIEAKKLALDWQSCKTLIEKCMIEFPARSAYYKNLRDTLEVSITPFVAQAYGSSRRIKPVSIALFGPSSVGKTTAVNRLVTDVMPVITEILSTIPDFEGTPAHEVYKQHSQQTGFRSLSCVKEKIEYDDGYNYQAWYVFEELYTSTDTTINNAWANHVFEVIDEQPLQLNGAFKKGTDYFDSPFVAMTGNSNCGHTLPFKDHTAYHRRLDFDFIVSRMNNSPSFDEGTLFTLSKEAREIYGNKDKRPNDTPDVLMSFGIDMFKPMKYHQVLLALAITYVRRITSRSPASVAADVVNKFYEHVPITRDNLSKIVCGRVDSSFGTKRLDQDFINLDDPSSFQFHRPQSTLNPTAPEFKPSAAADGKDPVAPLPKPTTTITRRKKQKNDTLEPQSGMTKRDRVAMENRAIFRLGRWLLLQDPVCISLKAQVNLLKKIDFQWQPEYAKGLRFTFNGLNVFENYAKAYAAARPFLEKCDNFCDGLSLDDDPRKVNFRVRLFMYQCHILLASTHWPVKTAYEIREWSRTEVAAVFHTFSPYQKKRASYLANGWLPRDDSVAERTRAAQARATLRRLHVRRAKLGAKRRAAMYANKYPHQTLSAKLKGHHDTFVKGRPQARLKRSYVDFDRDDRDHDIVLTPHMYQDDKGKEKDKTPRASYGGYVQSPARQAFQGHYHHPLCKLCKAKRSDDPRVVSHLCCIHHHQCFGTRAPDCTGITDPADPNLCNACVLLAKGSKTTLTVDYLSSYPARRAGWFSGRDDDPVDRVMPDQDYSDDMDWRRIGYFQEAKQTSFLVYVPELHSVFLRKIQCSLPRDLVPYSHFFNYVDIHKLCVSQRRWMLDQLIKCNTRADVLSLSVYTQYIASTGLTPGYFEFRRVSKSIAFMLRECRRDGREMGYGPSVAKFANDFPHLSDGFIGLMELLCSATSSPEFYAEALERVGFDMRFDVREKDVQKALQIKRIHPFIKLCSFNLIFDFVPTFITAIAALYVARTLIRGLISIVSSLIGATVKTVRNVFVHTPDPEDLRILQEALADSDVKVHSVENKHTVPVATPKVSLATRIQAKEGSVAPHSGNIGITKKIIRNSYAIVGAGRIGGMLAIRGSLFVLNKHVWRALPQEFMIYRFIPTNGAPRLFNIVKRSCQVVHELEDRDYIFVYVPSMQNHANITAHFISREHCPNVFGACAVSMDLETFQYEIQPVADFKLPLPHARVFNVKGQDYKIAIYGSYTWSGSQPGACGTPICIEDGAMKLFGLHGAGNQNSRLGFAEPLYLEDLDFTLPEDVIAQGGHLSFAESEEGVYSFDYDKGRYECALQTDACGSTCFSPTPFVEWSHRPADCAPAVLSREAYAKAIAKEAITVDNPTLHPEVWSIIDSDRGQIMDHFTDCDQSSLLNCRTLTAEEAIDGTDLLDGFDLSTSVGIRCKLSGIDKTKVREPGVHRQSLLALVQKKLSLFMLGLFTLQINADCLKDETRDLERVEARKTRLFNVTDFVDNILVKMALGDLIGRLKKMLLMGCAMCGMSPTCSEWAVLYRKFRNKSIVFMDFAGWDHLSPIWIRRIVGPWLYRLYGFGFAGDFAMWAYLSAIQAIRFNRGIGRRIDRGGSSGNWGTTFFNTINNHVLHDVTFAYLYQYHCSPDWTQELRLFIKVLYSDDNVSSAPFPFWTTKNVALTMKYLFGANLTSTSKEAITSESKDESYTIDDADFLSRRFVSVDGIVYAPLHESSLFSQLYYVRCPKARLCSATLYQQLQINLANVSRELVEYPKDVAIRWREKIQAFLRENSIPCYFPSVPYENRTELKLAYY